MYMYHFLTYGSGEPYHFRAKELARSALGAGCFDSATVATKGDLDKLFCEQNKSTLSIARGGGLWLFKPYVILKRLLSMGDNELLCYCDSLYLFQKDFRPFVDTWLAKSDVGIARHKPNEPVFMENEWTKMDAYRIMNVPFEVASITPQAWGGFLLLRKNVTTIRFVTEWLTYCIDPRVLRSSPCIFKNCPDFRAHREDQSLLSLLAKKWGIRFCDFPPDVLLNLRCPTPKPKASGSRDSAHESSSTII